MVFMPNITTNHAITYSRQFERCDKRQNLKKKSSSIFLNGFNLGLIDIFKSENCAVEYDNQHQRKELQYSTAVV